MTSLLQSISRIYKLNIPNIFYWSPKITLPRILSCHLRWLAILMPIKPLKNGLFKLAYFFESGAIAISSYDSKKIFQQSLHKLLQIINGNM